mmetsp:Transcript_26324/g.68034  ORF Transcript_26324/g.68034 Transcript_26324/m.68034 type:complete len:877 (-) Transcript_26324:195-2825(-)
MRSVFPVLVTGHLVFQDNWSTAGSYTPGGNSLDDEDALQRAVWDIPETTTTAEGLVETIDCVPGGFKAMHQYFCCRSKDGKCRPLDPKHPAIGRFRTPCPTHGGAKCQASFWHPRYGQCGCSRRDQLWCYQRGSHPKSGTCTTCDQTGTARMVNGTCVCKPGYRGKNCEVCEPSVRHQCQSLCTAEGRYLAHASMAKRSRTRNNAVIVGGLTGGLAATYALSTVGGTSGLYTGLIYGGVFGAYFGGANNHTQFRNNTPDPTLAPSERLSRFFVDFSGPGLAEYLGDELGNNHKILRPVLGGLVGATVGGAVGSLQGIYFGNTFMTLLDASLVYYVTATATETIARQMARFQDYLAVEARCCCKGTSCEYLPPCLLAGGKLCPAGKFHNPRGCPVLPENVVYDGVTTHSGCQCRQLSVRTTNQCLSNHRKNGHPWCFVDRSTCPEKTARSTRVAGWDWCRAGGFHEAGHTRGARNLDFLIEDTSDRNARRGSQSGFVPPSFYFTRHDGLACKNYGRRCMRPLVAESLEVCAGRCLYRLPPQMLLEAVPLVNDTFVQVNELSQRCNISKTAVYELFSNSSSAAEAILNSRLTGSEFASLARNLAKYADVNSALANQPVGDSVALPYLVSLSSTPQPGEETPEDKGLGQRFKGFVDGQAAEKPHLLGSALVDLGNATEEATVVPAFQDFVAQEQASAVSNASTTLAATSSDPPAPEDTDTDDTPVVPAAATITEDSTRLENMLRVAYLLGRMSRWEGFVRDHAACMQSVRSIREALTPERIRAAGLLLHRERVGECRGVAYHTGTRKCLLMPEEGIHLHPYLTKSRAGWTHWRLDEQYIRRAAGRVLQGPPEGEPLQVEPVDEPGSAERQREVADAHQQ